MHRNWEIKASPNISRHWRNYGKSLTTSGSFPIVHLNLLSIVNCSQASKYIVTANMRYTFWRASMSNTHLSALKSCLCILYLQLTRCFPSLSNKKDNLPHPLKMINSLPKLQNHICVAALMIMQTSLTHFSNPKVSKSALSTTNLNIPLRYVLTNMAFPFLEEDPYPNEDWWRWDLTQIIHSYFAHF